MQIFPRNGKREREREKAKRDEKMEQCFLDVLKQSQEAKMLSPIPLLTIRNVINVRLSADSLFPSLGQYLEAKRRTQ